LLDKTAVCCQVFGNKPSKVTKSRAAPIFATPATRFAQPAPPNETQLNVSSVLAALAAAPAVWRPRACPLSATLNKTLL